VGEAGTGETQEGKGRMWFDRGDLTSSLSILTPRIAFASGHIFLELGQPTSALVEYLHVRTPFLSFLCLRTSYSPSLLPPFQALHHAGPDRGREIRAVICDMARVLSQEELREGGA
jgi:hypothetical protein